MDSIETELINIVGALEERKAFPSIKSIMTICLNLCEHPKDEKYRTLRCNNTSVANTLMNEPSAIMFLEKIGFVKVDGFMSLIGNDPLLYKTAVTVLGRKRQSTNKTSINNTIIPNGPAQTPEPSPARYQSLGRPPPGMKRVMTPKHTWQDVIEHKYLSLSGLPPFGECILLYGPSGSGRTLVAHAAAEAWGLSVFTIYGSEVHTPFAKSRSGILKHLLKHAQEVSPSLVLLRGMDNILSNVVEEIRNEFKQLPSLKLVIMALCTSTEKLINASNCNLPRVSPNRLLKSMSRQNNNTCQPPLTIHHSNQEDSFRNQLSCFDILVHVPLLQNPSSIALLLQRLIEKNGGILPSSVSRMICTFIGSYSGSEGMSGHTVNKVATMSVEIARQRGAQSVDHQISISSDILREAFDKCGVSNISS